ncbi:unnamed protein product [Thelazia callipaeda]|uniref:STI1 domain-containing protein n=1 Tax=Thelazia callipaeda TaxID=103827 RepID=A0A0N5D3H9_THECL|nr:unnamed protein product [Thelazia callipaeda]
MVFSKNRKSFLDQAKKILEHNRSKERRQEEKELKARRERVKQAQEARKRAEEDNKHAGDGAGFGMPKGFEKIFQDPEILSLMQDEAVLAAYMDITSNPANIAKHLSNPKVMKLMSKIGNIGGFGMNTGNMQAGASPTFTGATKDEKTPNKVPEPDLD